MITEEMVTSALTIPGKKVVKNLGIARGLVVRSRSIVGSFFGDILTVFGGQNSIYMELCEHARQDAYQQLLHEAYKLRANAIIGFRYDATELAPGLTEVLAYGTACWVEDDTSA
ncbi:MAG: YbjQ family protein [Vampirovibrionales bacterium]|nr:YbjQ family protein [Vampirovibrionales bacterium]